MIFVIMPLVQGTTSLLPRALAYTFVLIVTGTALFGAIAAIGAPLAGGTTPAAVVAAFTMLCVLRELKLIRLPLPSRAWQVPRHWLRVGAYRSAVAYGAVMGVGFLTRAPFATYHVAVIWAFLSGSLLHGAYVGLSFAAGRALTLLMPRLVASRDSGTPEIARSQFLLERPAIVHLANAIALAALAAFLFAEVSRS
jgi:hypothetical protein